MPHSALKKTKDQPPNREADLLDANMLTSIRNLSPGNEDFLSELIDLFLERIPVLLETLRTSHKKKDLQSFTSTAHSLKGSCGNMGANQMMQICALLEERGHAGSLEGLSDQISKLETDFVKVKMLLIRDWRR